MTEPTSGTMISTFGCLACFELVAGRFGDGPDLQGEQAGDERARA